MILCDTGVLLCLIDKDQSQHDDYSRAVTENREAIVTTWACVTEAMYLALGVGGWRTQRNLSKMLTMQFVTIYDIATEDYARLFALMEKYQDRPMDLADATLVLTAEKTKTKRILTLDSDFLFYRIGGKNSFDIIKV